MVNEVHVAVGVHEFEVYTPLYVVVHVAHQSSVTSNINVTSHEVQL